MSSVRFISETCVTSAVSSFKDLFLVLHLICFISESPSRWKSFPTVFSFFFYPIRPCQQHMSLLLSISRVEGDRLLTIAPLCAPMSPVLSSESSVSYSLPNRWYDDIERETRFPPDARSRTYARDFPTCIARALSPASEQGLSTKSDSLNLFLSLSAFRFPFNPEIFPSKSFSSIYRN